MTNTSRPEHGGWCSAALEAFGVDAECCNLCHEELRRYEVCCNVAIAIENSLVPEGE